MNNFRLDPRLREELVNTYLDAVPLIILNVIWCLVSLPLITIFPATAGLFYATNRLAHGQSGDWHVFFDGMRRYFWQSLLWGSLNLIAAAVVFSNTVFYAQGHSAWTTIAHLVVLGLALGWGCIQVYMFPLLLEQEHPRFGLALRNSLVIVLKRPLFSLGITVLILMVALFSTAFIWPVWIVITAAFCAWTANNATIASIARISTQKAASESLQDEKL